MRNVIFVFALGVLVGVAGHWYFSQPEAPQTVAEAQEEISTGVAEAERTVRENIDTETFRREVDRGREQVRETVSRAGEALKEATSDIRITAAVKAKLIQDSRLEGLKINVDTTDGVVTLSGTVASPEDISRAMRLARETEGVTKVASTLQVNAQ